MVLLQSGEGGGLSGIAAGGSATQMMGQRRATDFLSKATGYLGGAFLVLCVVANFFIGGGQQKSAIQQEGANAVQNNAAVPSQSKSAVPLNQKGGKTAIPPQNNSKTGNGNGGGNKPSGN